MEGFLINGMGSNWEVLQGGSSVSVSLAAAMHWYLRVSRIGVSYSFARNSDSATISGGFETDKMFPIFANPLRFVGSEDELVTRPRIPFGAALEPVGELINPPYFISGPNPLAPNALIGLCGKTTLPIDFAANRWTLGFAPRCGLLQAFSVAGPGPFDSSPAGTFNLEAIDPITGEDYTVTGPMYYGESPDDDSVTGNMTITPVAYYTWNGRYNATTGAYADGRQPPF